MYNNIYSIKKNVQTRVIYGFLNNDNVSCYVNTNYFYCDSFVIKIRNNQLRSTLPNDLLQYDNNYIVPEIISVRTYLTNEFDLYNDI